MTNPIFVCGCERSGTTMLASMLAKAEGLVIIPEAPFLVKLFDKFSLVSPYNQLVKFILNDKRFAIWKFNLQPIEADFLISIADFMRRVVESYCRRSDFLYWVDHTPWSICHAKRLKNLFPEAKFINLIRDGRAVAASIKKLPDWPFGSVLGVSQHWKYRVVCGLAAERALPGSVQTVKYEDLVLTPDDALANICRFIGIQYHLGMKAGDMSVVTDYTTKQHQLVGSHVCIDRVTAWKHELSMREIELFECDTSDLLPLLGYELITTASDGISRMVRTHSFLADSLAAATSRWKRRRRWLNSQR